MLAEEVQAVVDALEAAEFGSGTVGRVEEYVIRGGQGATSGCRSSLVPACQTQLFSWIGWIFDRGGAVWMSVVAAVM